MAGIYKAIPESGNWYFCKKLDSGELLFKHFDNDNIYTVFSAWKPDSIRTIGTLRNSLPTNIVVDSSGKWLLVVNEDREFENSVQGYVDSLKQYRTVRYSLVSLHSKTKAETKLIRELTYQPLLLPHNQQQTNIWVTWSKVENAFIFVSGLGSNTNRIEAFDPQNREFRTLTTLPSSMN